MISSAIEALRSGESRGNHRPEVAEVAADRAPYILPAAAPHTVAVVGACNILCDSDLRNMFCFICFIREKILAPDANVW